VFDATHPRGIVVALCRHDLNLPKQGFEPVRRSLQGKALERELVALLEPIESQTRATA